MRFRTLSVVAALPLFAAAAEPKPAAAPASTFSLTIYSSADPATFDPHVTLEQQSTGAKLPGYGVVREVRRIDVPAGEGTVKFTDVASGIDPTTVSFKSLTAPDTTAVLDQSYEYDLVSPDKLLEKYIGKAVIINRRTPVAGGAPGQAPTSQLETLEGTLLAYDGTNFVLQTNNLQLPVQIVPRNGGISEIKLFDLKTGLITKPTLVWKLRAQQGGSHDAQVTYQTDNLTWRADYNLVVNKDDTAADVGAWVSILNESGASYADAKLKLVAGDVHRLVPRQHQMMQVAQSMSRFGGARPPQFEEKAFFEYHLYTLQRTTSIANHSTKQIELFPTRRNIPVEKVYVYYGQPVELRTWTPDSPATDRNLGTQTNKQVDLYLKLQNTEKNGMGLPLPAGRVRVYKKDEADAADEFVGEDVIQHTPKDEQLLVRLGSAFDVVGERKQTNFTLDEAKHELTESIEISLRNHKTTPVNVIVKENLFRWLPWNVTESSDKFEKQDARTVHFPVDVPAGGEKKVTYTVKYTW